MVCKATIVAAPEQTGDVVTQKEACGAKQGLDEEEFVDEAILSARTKRDEPEIHERHVAGAGDGAGWIAHEVDETQAVEQGEAETHGGTWRVRKVCVGRFHEAGAGIEGREAMAGTGHEFDELGQGVDEVEGLGQEQQQQGLAKVAEDGDGGEEHAGKVAVGVADKDLGWVAVVGPEGDADAEKRQEEVEGEEVRVGRRGEEAAGEVGVEIDGIVEEEQQRNDDGLRHLESVEAGQDVDAVGRKDAQRKHVCVVNGSQVDEGGQRERRPCRKRRQHNRRHAKVGVVDDEQRNRCQAGNEELVSPAQVEQVVGDAKDRRRLKCENR